MKTTQKLDWNIAYDAYLFIFISLPRAEEVKKFYNTKDYIIW